MVILITGFIKKVWEKLEPTFVDKTAASIENWLGRLSWRYEKTYRQHLIYRHRVFDVKGLTTQGIYSLELNKVFVELSIAPRPPHTVSSNPIPPLPPELEKGSHPIWDYLKADTLTHANLAIIGSPGSGKTTLLKHLALALANKKKISMGKRE